MASVAEAARRRSRVYQPTLFAAEAKAHAAHGRWDRTVADLFCGGGGSSSGAVQAYAARGETVRLVAVNHNPIAVASHEANHPTGAHYCHPIDGITPTHVVPEGKLDLLLASPQCTGFSSNVSGRAVSAEERALCWQVLPWLATLAVRTFLIENVPAFRRAGPLLPDGRPDPARAGEEYRAFLAALRSVGYTVDERVVNAADYGVPQERERLFILGVKGNGPVRWPMPTHGPAGSGRTPHRTAREILDWDDVGTPVTAAAKRARLSAYTFAMIAKGRAAFGGAPFLIPRRQGTNAFVRSVDRPLMTVVASSPCVALIQFVRGVAHHRLLTPVEYLRSMSFAETYVLHGRKDDQERMIGNAIPPLLVRHLVTALVASDAQ